MAALELIRGRITELQISKGYEDLVFTDTSKNMVGAAAVGAAAMGQIFNSATLAISSAGAELSMEYFTCLADGRRLLGRFHKTGFKEGDEIEFVVAPTESAFAVLAARNPEQRLIWMLPYHERGYKIQHNFFTKWTLLLSSIASGSLVGFSYLNVDSPNDAPWWVFLSIFFGMFIGCILVGLFIHSFFVRFSRATTLILNALGYDDAENVDLNKLNRAAHKRIQQETGQRADTTSPWVFRY